MSKGHHRVGYVRVSAFDQNTDRQLDGVELDRVFTDRCSGKDTNRPQLKAALQHLRDGDTLVVHSLDRLARNAKDLLDLVSQLIERGITVQFVKNQLTFSGKSDAMAKLMLTLLAAFSEFERGLIRERQAEGIALAKAKGVYKGRKKSLSPEQANEVTELARSGVPKADIAKSYGVSRETLYQYLRGS